jgi:hypothetical protein
MALSLAFVLMALRPEPKGPVGLSPRDFNPGNRPPAATGDVSEGSSLCLDVPS